MDLILLSDVLLGLLQKQTFHQKDLQRESNEEIVSAPSSPQTPRTRRLVSDTERPKVAGVVTRKKIHGTTEGGVEARLG